MYCFFLHLQICLMLEEIINNSPSVVLKTTVMNLFKNVSRQYMHLS